MTVEMWTYIMVGVSFAIYMYIGYANTVRDTKGFYVAGQDVPAWANGMATGADWMSAATFISMAGLISTMGHDGAVYLMGWTGGYVLLALLLAPYLRKFGKFTVPDFVGDRYYSSTARAIAAIAAVIISFTYVAGQMRGVGIVFSRFLGMSIDQGVIVGTLIVAFFSIIGGMKGITWTQAAQYIVLLMAYLVPSIAIAFQLTGNPIPQLALTAGDIIPKLNQIQQDFGFSAYTNPFQGGRTMIDVLAITCALMVGTAGLPHVIVRFYTVPNVRDARLSAGYALVCIALVYTTAPALAAFARYNMLDTMNKATFTGETRELPNKQLIQTLKDGNGNTIDWATKWQVPGLMAVADRNGDGKVTMSSGPSPFVLKAGKPDFSQPINTAVTDKDGKKTENEVYLDNDIIVLSTPEVANLPAWVVGLMAAGGLAAALSTASGLLLVISSSFAHDIYFRLINPKADEANRLLVGRVTIAVACVVAGYFGINPPAFVAQVVAFAFGLAASSFFPVIILGIFDKRMNDKGAIAGMLTGLIFTIIMIGGMRSVPLLGTATPMIPPFFGINAEGIGTVGMILNFIVSFAVSRSTPPPPKEIQDLIENLRLPTGAGQASAH